MLSANIHPKKPISSKKHKHVSNKKSFPNLPEIQINSYTAATMPIVIPSEAAQEEKIEAVVSTVTAPSMSESPLKTDVVEAANIELPTSAVVIELPVAAENEINHSAIMKEHNSDAVDVAQSESRKKHATIHTSQNQVVEFNADSIIDAEQYESRKKHATIHTSQNRIVEFNADSVIDKRPKPKNHKTNDNSGFYLNCLAAAAAVGSVALIIAGIATMHAIMVITGIAALAGVMAYGLFAKKKPVDINVSKNINPSEIFIHNMPDLFSSHFSY